MLDISRVAVVWDVCWLMSYKKCLNIGKMATEVTARNKLVSEEQIPVDAKYTVGSLHAALIVEMTKMLHDKERMNVDYHVSIMIAVNRQLSVNCSEWEAICAIKMSHIGMNVSRAKRILSGQLNGKISLISYYRI